MPAVLAMPFAGSDVLATRSTTIAPPQVFPKRKFACLHQQDYETVEPGARFHLGRALNDFIPGRDNSTRHSILTYLRSLASSC